MMKMHEIGNDLSQDDSQDRSAKQRGLVAHTTRPGTPESVEHQINPLEDRMINAERYYQPRDVGDGLGQDGGPAVGDPADPAPTEVEEAQGEQDSNKEPDLHSPKVIRAPRQPTPKEREIHEAIHLPHENWCEFCVRGRARNKPHLHRRGLRARASPLPREELVYAEEDKEEEVTKEEDGVPRISMDYFYLGDTRKDSIKESVVNMTTK